MNLYIISEANRATDYGLGTYIRELTESLKDSDINVCVIHLRSDKPNNESQHSDSIEHLHIPPPINLNISKESDNQRELYYRNIAYLLQLHIKDTEKPVFHLNKTQGNLAAILRETFVCTIITTIHYLEWCFYLSGNTSQFKQILAIQETERMNDLQKLTTASFQREKECFQTADRIICLSEHTRQILQADYSIKPDKITVLCNGLTDNIPVVKRLVLRQKYYLSNSPVILFAGRLDNLKGLTYALRAFKTVLNTYPHCRFLIAGNGAFDVFMQECEDIWMHVTWTGLINRAKLYELYIIADIGIMPSFTEQCSYVAIEMMMHGLPIIGSATAGLKEMVEDGETGLHIPVIEHDESVEIDSSLLAEKMLYLLQHPEERKRMGINARKRYKRLYTSELMRKNMLRFYNSLIFI